MDSITGKVTPVNQGDGASNKPYHIYGHNLKNALAENKHEIKVNNLIEKSQVLETCWDQLKGLWTYLIEDTLETTEF